MEVDALVCIVSLFFKCKLQLKQNFKIEITYSEYIFLNIGLKLVKTVLNVPSTGRGILISLNLNFVKKKNNFLSCVNLIWILFFCRYGPKYNVSKGSYTQEQIESMIKVVTEAKTTQPITYPVRAALATDSITVFSNLLKSRSENKPTLTIWSSEGDTVDAVALSKLIKDIGVDKVYVDVPADLWAKLDLASAASVATSSMIMVGSVIASIAVTKLI